MKLLKKYKNKSIFIKSLAIVVGMTTILHSCDDDRFDDLTDGINLQQIPVSNFDFVIDGQDVTFTNNAANGDVFEWDFGENSTTDNISVVDNLPVTATYNFDDGQRRLDTITLSTRNNGANVTNQFSLPIEFIQADFTVADLNENVASFESNSLAAVSYLWDFGDGIGTSTEQNPTYEYSDFETFSVSLTVTDRFGNTDVFTNDEIVIAIPGAGTFEAVLINGDFESYPTSQENNNDLVDAWTVDPDNTFNDGTANPYNFWRNDALESWVSDPANNGGSGTTDKASSSGTDAQSAGGTSGRSFKMDSSGERAYQPFQAEIGVEYTITAFVKSESTPVGDVEATFHILSAEPEADTELSSLSIISQEVISEEINGWRQISFTFIVDETFSFSQEIVDESTDDFLTSVDQEFVIFYFVPTNTVTSDNEVFLTDVVISTLGF